MAWRVRSLLGEASYTYRVLSHGSLRRTESTGAPALAVVAAESGDQAAELVARISARWPAAALVVISVDRRGDAGRERARSLRRLPAAEAALEPVEILTVRGVGYRHVVHPPSAATA